MTDFYCDEVLSGHTAVAVVDETERVLAFRHTRPHYAEHVVVIPKQHIESLLELPADDGLATELMMVVQRVAQAMNAEHGGCHVVTNVGSYQDSKHLHWHVGSGELAEASERGEGAGQ